jgi:hypothetical protein
VNVHFQINQQGMRADHDYAYAKPANVFRIVSIGDSFAMGYEVEPEQIYSSVLEQQLTATGHPTEVLNAGVSGFSTAEELLYLERELIKFHPDLVLLGFYYNDFDDNVRTDLFTVDDQGQLHEKNRNYVPLGRIGNLLNSNPIFNFLSEYSNAFALAKERATYAVKRMMIEHAEGEAKKAAEQELEVPDPTAGDLYPVSDYERALAVGLLERLYQFCHEHDVNLVIMSIPTGGIPDPNPDFDRPMVDLFPYEQFDTNRPGLAVLPAIDLLEPYYGKQELVHRHSHRHWTPFAHRIAGDALTKLVLERGFVTDSSGRGATANTQR